MKSTTVIKYLRKTVDGIIFQDDFESLTFLTDNKWIVQRGSPKTDYTYYFNGQRSFIMDNTNPYISKTLSETPKYFSVWFYDDPAFTNPNQKPFFLIGNSPNQWGIGLDPAISTTKYTVYNNGVPQITLWNRPGGAQWTFFEILYDPTIPQIIIKVGGLTALTETPSGPIAPVIWLGALANPGSPSVFGAWDTLLTSKGNRITMRGLNEGDFMGAYFPYNNNYAELTGGVANSNGIVSGFYNQNYNPSRTFFFLLSKPINYGILSLRYHGDDILIAPGDEYYYHEIDFGRKVTALDVKKTSKRNDKESTSGVNEAIFFNARDVGTISMNDITNEQKDELVNWYASAQLAQTYAVAVDNEDIVSARLVSDASPGDSIIYCWEREGYDIGRSSALLLKRADNLYFEKVSVLKTEKIAVPHPVYEQWKVTLKSPIINAYSAGDSLRSILYFPKVISVDKTLNLTLSSLKKKRWNFTNNFKESL